MVAASSPAIQFFVRGQPVTEGSIRSFHRWQPEGRCVVSLVHDNGARLAEWRALIATAAKRAMRDKMPLSGPVSVKMTFYFERPNSHTAAQRACPYVVVRRRHDGDKLQRAVLDALSMAALWEDDSQAVMLEAIKVYADAEGEHPGVVVAVEAL